MCCFIQRMSWGVMSNIIILERFNHGSDGTFGKWKFPTGEEYFTVEQPWNNNEPFKSCIPPGVYYLEKRHSPIVKQTSGGEFTEGWEVTGVPNREYCMLHPANWPMDVAGCIGPGLRYAITRDRKNNLSNSVMDSRDAFRQMMGLLDEKNSWALDVRPFFYSWP